MLAAYHGRLRHFLMIDERAFHFHGADSMPRHIDHVIDAAEDPVIALVVLLRAITREVHGAVPLAPVLRDEALRISVDAAEHRGPRARERQQSASNGDGGA